MDIRELRCLVTVMECGSYTKASERLCVSRQAVAKTVSQLERQLGESLVESHGRMLSLTARGRSVARQAKPIIDAFDDLCDRELPSSLASAATQGLPTTAGSAHGARHVGTPRERLSIALVTGGDQRHAPQSSA